MTDLASASDVSAVFGDLTPLQSTQVGAWLARLSAMVRLRIPTFDARIVASPDLGVLAKGVLVDAVVRVLRNPDGKLQESIDDYSYRRADSVADGALYLTDAEWRLLVDPSVSATSAAFTVRPQGQRDPIRYGYRYGPWRYPQEWTWYP